MDKKFETQFFAGFDDTDLGGVVFFGNYYRIAHKGLEQFILNKGLTWNQWFQSSEFLVPLVHSEADYKKPLFAGSTYNLKIQIDKLSESSVTFGYEILSDSGEELALLKTVHVFVDKNTFQKIAIPAEIRSALA